MGVIDNALTLIGMNPYLIYATKGFILFAAIVTDQLKVNVRRNVLMKEELYKYSLRTRDTGERQGAAVE